MRRRDFLKAVSALTVGAKMPSMLVAAASAPIGKVAFSLGAPLVVVFLCTSHGGLQLGPEERRYRVLEEANHGLD